MRTPVVTVVSVLLALTAGACRGTLELEPSDHDTILSTQALEAPDPAQKGDFQVETFYYGRGDDLRRPEFRDSVLLRTGSVDASFMVSLGDNGKERREYWGFSPDSFPVNGRVWHPVGEGPFPLVLVAHGNHDMKDFSDPGYDYLGEHLASRGYILASLDMNFLNGSIRGENDARGWMFLKHLQEWERFNELEESPLRGKVELDRVSLIGHSRGGEAVGHAAAFNTLGHYPDDANQEFEFGFGIRSIVAIAPVDGQYRPSDQGVPLTDVSYLVFHGSHDGDVTSFHGLRQYNRVTFTPDFQGFKAAIYVYRANHGQWNTVWGARDNGPRSDRILDLRGLLAPEDQRRFALVYVTSFLEATLRGDGAYLPLFMDHRVAGGWLPQTMYITRFQDASYRSLASFDEDIDVTTGSLPGVELRGDSLGTWREGTLTLRSRNRTNTSASQETQAVWLGWNRAVQGAPEGELGRPGRYQVILPAGLASEWSLDGASTLDFALGPTDSKPGPRKRENESEGEEQSGEGGASNRGGEEREVARDDEEAPEPVDLSIELRDASGETASVALSRYGPVRHPLEMRILRRRDVEDDRYPQRWELILQGYSIPLVDFTRENPALDLGGLSSIGFVFDRTVAGEVVMDDLGFSRPEAGFLAARVSGDPVPGGS
jgi:dienelactone hydrolase